MGNGIRVKYKHLFSNLNRAKPKSGEKIKKAIEWYIDLLKKEKKEGMTKWIFKTKIKAEARLKKYGITNSMVQTKISSKGLNDLLS